MSLTPVPYQWNSEATTQEIEFPKEKIPVKK